MLSGESANGQYPVEAAETMARIAQATEEKINYANALSMRKISLTTNVADAISLSACITAEELGAAAIITATQSGRTAKTVSKHRPGCTIIAITPREKVARALALNWGVTTLISEPVNSTDKLIEESIRKSMDASFVKKDDLAIIVAGIPVDYAGSTNMFKVAEIK